MKFAVAALLGCVQALTTDKTITYSDSLKCGGCIRGGYNFCVRGTVEEIIADGGSPPITKCC